jgi:IS1 family transposase
MDEQWQFINKKAKHVQQGDPSEYGDCWLYIALAATQKAIISYTVGKRNDASTREFLGDLRQRIVNRVQITSDGYPGYPSAMAATFGHDVDFATIVKHYAVEGTGTDAAHRYSPSKVTGSERTVIRGRPATEHISTSYVERFNLSSRMQMRRFTRLTNGFSKKLANHRAAIALWVCFYNLCRVHESLRMTPAMALGVTDHIWSIGELIAAAQEPEEAPPLPLIERLDTLGGRTPFRRNRPHAAGVLALVAVANRLVVLSGRQQNKGFSVAERMNGNFLSVKKFLNPDFTACLLVDMFRPPCAKDPKMRLPVV